MAFNAKDELERVKKHYAGDPLQKRFSALITGETNTGKTYMLRTARMPVHIDSFDPGSSKSLRADTSWKLDDPRRITSLNTPDNPQGQIFVDTSFENEDPYKPTAYASWKKSLEIRKLSKYFDMFGTYCIDGLTTLSQAIMNEQLASRGFAGQMPTFTIDYTPQKIEIENKVREIMNLPCDFILTGHLEPIVKLKGIDKKGIRDEETVYRLMITGKAVMTIPLLFDELYVLKGSGQTPRREMLVDSLGTYIARSRYKASVDTRGFIDPDFKAFFKKVGLDWEDKERI